MVRSKPSSAPPPATPPRPAAAHAPPPAQTHAPAAHAPPPPQHAPVVSQGPGLMGTMAATAAGAVAGNAVSNMLFGGRGGGSESAAPATGTQAPAQGNPCASQLNQFMKCVEANDNNVTGCQYSWETVAQCRKQTGQMWF